MEIAHHIWSQNGLPVEYLSHLKLQGAPDDVIDSSFRIGAIAQASIGLAGLAAAYLHYLQTGVEREVTVNARHAALEFKSQEYYTVDGQAPEDVWDTIAGLYPTKDKSYVRIHTNFPHHRRGVLEILGLPDHPDITKSQVGNAILQWKAEDFEDEAARRGMCVTAYRTFDTWDIHPHAIVMKNALPVTITKIGDAPQRDASDLTLNVNIKGKGPLEGFKVLDLSRVLAGPIAGRTLATYGADVLWVTSPELPSLPALDLDTSRGKRKAQLDLNKEAGREMLKELVQGSDVFLQAYRPGGLPKKGFGCDDLVKLKPGIICANLCAWGWEGDWKDRRGFDSLVQTATGFNYAEAEAFHTYLHPDQPLPNPLPPKPFPVQAIDHAAAYFLAFGIIIALCKSITEGGSYEVQVSLLSTANYLRSLGRILPTGRPLPPKQSPLHPEILSLSTPIEGTVPGMIGLKHAGVLSP